MTTVKTFEVKVTVTDRFFDEFRWYHVAFVCSRPIGIFPIGLFFITKWLV
ncbi:hypothetical protein L6D_13270 [Enterococcus faecalis]|nr:hypothetical protein L6D_13270 [Enterococcus faecalis]GMC11501.1 hypothetical protein L3D_09470 [Enterococcus faecalis]